MCSMRSSCLRERWSGAARLRRALSDAHHPDGHGDGRFAAATAQRFRAKARHRARAADAGARRTHRAREEHRFPVPHVRAGRAQRVRTRVHRRGRRARRLASLQGVRALARARASTCASSATCRASASCSTATAPATCSSSPRDRDAGPGAARSDGARCAGRVDRVHGYGGHRQPAARRARRARR